MGLLCWWHYRKYHDKGGLIFQPQGPDKNPVYPLVYGLAILLGPITLVMSIVVLIYTEITRGWYK